MTDIKGAVQSQFGDAAANYRTSAVHATGQDLEVMVSALALTSNMHILDAGCGAGHAGMVFAPHVGKVTAVDFTPAMLEQVMMLADERSITNVETQQGDVESLPFPDATFDVVISRYSAHHWLHPQTALHEFQRVLKPGGAVILSDIMASASPAQDTFLQVLEVLRDPSHVRDHSVSQWLAMLQTAGFSGEVLMEFELTLDFAAWIQRINTPQQNADMLRTLFDGAGDEIKAAFHLPADVIRETFDFVIPGGVVLGRKA